MFTNIRIKNKLILFCHPALDAGSSINSNSGFRLGGRNDKRNSFTLIELLVVLALVAILSVVVVVTLNPAELLKQARDSNRLSDLSTINTALNLFSADVTSGFMGTSTIVYVSIPDTSPTCANLGLPLIPTSTYVYHCVTTPNLRNTDGTGWIPVNFQRISSNSPISQLPVDPQNTTSTKYYTYVTGGSWKVIATPESQKYMATAGTDGGTNIGQFEVGNNMSLAPFVDGLVGWWKFDEGSGTSTVDSSGWGNNGTWNGTSTLRYGTGKFGAYAGSFNGSSDYVTMGDIDVFDGLPAISISAWVKQDFLASIKPIIAKFAADDNLGIILETGTSGLGGTDDIILTAAGGVSVGYSTGNIVSAGNWQYWTMVYDGSQTDNVSRLKLYLNGVVQTLAFSGTIPAIGNSTNHDLRIGAPSSGDATMRYFNGFIDDARIYSRALSAPEVLALYNSTK